MYRIDLSCTAELLTEATTLAHGQAHVAVPLTRLFEVVIEDLAERIVSGFPTPGKVGEVRLEEKGQRSELSDVMGVRLRSAMAERIRRREQRGVWTPIGGDAESEPASVPEYVLRGELRCSGEDEGDIEVWVEVHYAGDDYPVFGRGTYVAVESLPAGLKCAGGASERRHEAAGVAVVSERLDEKAAERGARNLARARVIALALDLSLPDLEEVSSEREMIEVLGPYLSQGLTVDERWSGGAPGVGGGERREKGVLSARVARVGGRSAPAVNASLGASSYAARQPISIEIRSEESAYLGVFAWGADNSVVRLYPRGGGT